MCLYINTTVHTRVCTLTQQYIHVFAAIYTVIGTLTLEYIHVFAPIYTVIGTLTQQYIHVFAPVYTVIQILKKRSLTPAIDSTVSSEKNVICIFTYPVGCFFIQTV